MTKPQNVLNSKLIQSDPILGELVKTLLRNKTALTDFVMHNGAENESIYRYGVGKFWGIDFALSEIERLVTEHYKEDMND